MNVTDSTSATSYLASTSATQAMQPRAGACGGGDGDGDDSGGRVHHHHGHHRGAGLNGAVMQALQSLGLTPSTDGSSASTSSSASSGGTASTDSAGATSIKDDMRSFMHALFEATRSQASGASSEPGDGSTATGSDRRGGFASDLSTLITQVGNGNAPSALQSAFDKLAGDLQATGTTSTGDATSGTDTGSDAVTTGSSVTLLQLLTQLQQNLGYGPHSAMASSGSIVGTSA